MTDALNEVLAVTPRRFKRYPAYKDSGVEWLGEIPTHWSIARISELTVLLNGYPFDSEFFTRGQGTPLVRIRDLNASETEINYVGPIVENAWIQSGDVILGMDGDFNVARWRGQRALLNQRMCCLRPRGSTESGFIAYLLPLPLKVINDLAYSTTVKHLASGDVRRVRLGAPPEAEQRAVTAFLDRETARIDALVVKKERLIELLQEKRTALITRAVTKGLDPTVPMKDSGVEWLGKIPGHWAVKKLAWLTKCLDGRRVPLNAEERGRLQGDYPYWGANSIVDHVGKWLFDEELVLLGEDGAPFFDRTRPVAFRVSGRIWVNNHAHVLRPGRKIDADFLAHALNCVDYRMFIDGTTRDKLTQGDMNAVQIQCPDVAEQRAIAEFLARETARIDALVAKVRDAIARLKELRTALISAAVTGKIDVRVDGL